MNEVEIELNRLVAELELDSQPITDYYGAEFVNICRTIRRLAESEKFRVDLHPHKANEGNNVHLFKMIEACGISVHNFVRDYLLAIQPYSLMRYDEKSQPSNSIWVADIGYKYRLVIKIENRNDETLVVSFHESNFKSRYTSQAVDFSNKLCAVLYDDIISATNIYSKIVFRVQRGFLNYIVSANTKNIINPKNKVALVKYEDIEFVVDSLLQDEVNKLTEMSGAEDFSITISPDTRISFMSFGTYDVNNISLLVDLYTAYTDMRSRRLLTDMLAGLLNTISDDRLPIIKEALKTKYGSYDNRLLTCVYEFGGVNED